MLRREAIARAIDLDSSFRGLGFAAADLDNEDFRLAPDACTEAVRRALDVFRRPALGLELGSRATLSSWGLAGMSFVLARSSTELFDLVVETQHAAGRLVGLRGEQHGPHHCLIAEPHGEDREVGGFLLDETFASLVHICRQIVGPHFNPRRVEFMGDRPRHGMLYEDVFRCPVQFRRPQNRLVFPGEPYAVPTGDPLLLRQVRQWLGALLPQGGLVQSQLEAALLATIRRNLADAPSLASVAESMHFTERTLRRRLASLGLAYADMVDRERQSRAMTLLSHSSCSMREIAAECGFAAERTLARAVKRWTGRSLGSLRKGAMAHGA